MRSLLPLLLIAATPANPDPARDPGYAVLAPDTEQRWVPFQLTAGNQIRFAMTLDGVPVTAILDTGVSFSVIARGSRALDPAQVRPGGSASAIGGVVPIGWMTTRSMSVGGLTRTGGGIGVAALPETATGSAGVDLLVGRDLIGEAAIDIDYAGHRFRLLSSGRLPFGGAVAPLRLSPELNVYQSEIMLGGRRLGPMVVDTGDGSAITVSQAAWASVGPASRPMTSAIAYGLAGPVVTALTIVPDLMLGDLDAREVEVRVEAAGGFSQGIAAAGRIGSGFLQHYRVLLDPKAGRMVLSANADAGTPPLRSTSGLLVGVLTDRLRVVHVMRGSPAEAAGWRNGDTICSVDGAPIPVDYAGNRLASWSVAAPGTVVRLGMCDGSARSLTTRSFY
ncbi:hypothetical protein [Sphingomonas bacterium]|uniref:hypothetical protein n=1 Tax=Sphingomonas bacterium TaxID=1895847 RepID=UPI00157685D5|nr:hypothetical protein [Sphingomonas bacterium]